MWGWERISRRFKKIQIKHKQNWEKYCKISQQQYDKRYNLAPTRDKHGKLVQPKHSFGFEPISKFKIGAKVLYYAGPHRPGINAKWRQKWTGPWHISNKVGKYRVKIVDNRGKGYEVDINRLKSFKQFKKNDLISYPEYKDTLEKLQKDKPTLSDDENWTCK